MTNSISKFKIRFIDSITCNIVIPSILQVWIKNLYLVILQIMENILLNISVYPHFTGGYLTLKKYVFE